MGNYTFGTYMANSFLLTLPSTLLTIASSLLIAYGFARFEFPCKKLLFSVMYGLMPVSYTHLMLQVKFLRSSPWCSSATS